MYVKVLTFMLQRGEYVNSKGGTIAPPLAYIIEILIEMSEDELNRTSYLILSDLIL